MNNGLPLHEQSFDALASALRSKKISATELAQYFLQRSKAYAHLGVFLAQDEDITLQQARAADTRLAEGDSNPLLGIPIAHKDIYVTRDFPSTAGSKMLNKYRSPFDATVVQNLAQAGMVSLGKLNCDEFAMGSANENSAYGVVRNPWDLSRVPGGSSGGSAAAVAAGLSPAVTGSDTGGSIRQPASFCGVTGIKPTYGRASRYGMVAFASSLDQAGPMARTAKDCALLLSALCGPDLERDSTSLDLPKEDFTAGLEGALSGKRIGVAQQFFGDGLDEDVRQALEQALKVYEKLGAQLVPIDLPLTELSIPAYYIIAPAEASSNLSRYDGVRYGFRADSFDDLNDMYRQSRSRGFGAEVQRRILLGTYVLSHGYYDAYYVKAQKIRRLIANDFQAAFALCDWIAAPCAPSVAWSIGAHQSNPLADYLADMYTLPASLAGLPAMAFPVGLGAAGLPVGMQLIANYGKEAGLLNAAHQFQTETDWHLKQPQAYLAAVSKESR